MLYQFECKLNDKGYYEFYKYQMKNNAVLKKYNLLCKLLVPVMFLFLIIYYRAIGFDWGGILFAAIIFGIISVVWVLFIAEPLGALSLMRRIKRMKKHGKIPNITTIEFYDGYFVETTKDTKTEIKYNAIYNVCINDKKAIYIYRNAVTAYAIPFNTFASDEQSEEFIRFIKGKISKDVLEKSV